MSLGLISYEDDDDYYSLQKLSYPEGARRKANQEIGVRLSFGSTNRSWREKLGGSRVGVFRLFFLFKVGLASHVSF